MDLKLAGKVVGITGGSTGIGAEIALGFAREGSKVAVCARGAANLEALKERFKAEGLEVLTYVCDVAVNAELKAFTEAIVAEFGQLDVFINNAGIDIRKPFDTLPEEEWHKLVNINFKSVFYGSAFAAEQMRKSGGGVIINTSSFTSIIPTCGIGIYSATKAAVDQLTRVFCAELAADNIRVVSVQPGMTVTPQTQDNINKNFDRLVAAIPMKRLASAQDMVAGYLFLASEQASYINGIALPITGGKFATQNPHYAYRDAGAQW